MRASAAFAVACLALSAAPASAQPATSSADVQVLTETVRFDPQNRPTPLNFGSVTSGGFSFVDAGGDGPPSPGAARFFVIGPALQGYSISLPSDPITLFSASGIPGAQVSQFQVSLLFPRVGQDGRDQFDVGAFIEVSSGASSGTYTGTFNVVIANQ